MSDFIQNSLTAEEAVALESLMRKLRLKSEEYVMVSVGNVSDVNAICVTVMKGGHKETSSAKYLVDAISLARHKIDAHFEKLRKKEDA